MQTFPTTQAFDLTEDQRNTLTHCLRIAAQKFTENVAHLKDGGSGRLYPEMRSQFDRQAAEARGLADRIESAEYVKLGREVE